ncbi:hypothetical protein HaLaN_19642 [Haematococcus lacustris]|uniref:Uncharacterized protein n=1 Tax=Haematococcus lacustris TaxID=44745 RepID=A0A699ZTX6_HAELA|nr:hypothetical protein HaLaN_19642 [Haematococcus lacustris]
MTLPVLRLLLGLMAGAPAAHTARHPEHAPGPPGPGPQPGSGLTPLPTSWPVGLQAGSAAAHP